MTNTERRAKFNTISSAFPVGCSVAIRHVMGMDEGVVEFVGWDHDTDTPFIAATVPSRFFGTALARASVENVFRKEA